MSQFRIGDVVMLVDCPDMVGCVEYTYPRALGDACRIVGLSFGYAVSLERDLRPTPTQYVAGQWIVLEADGPEPEGAVGYNLSPIAAMVGWKWWASDLGGDATSYADARRQVERVLNDTSLRSEP